MSPKQRSAGWLYSVLSSTDSRFTSGTAQEPSIAREPRAHEDESSRSCTRVLFLAGVQDPPTPVPCRALVTSQLRPLRGANPMALAKRQVQQYPDGLGKMILLQDFKYNMIHRLQLHWVVKHLLLLWVRWYYYKTSSTIWFTDFSYIGWWSTYCCFG